MIEEKTKIIVIPIYKNELSKSEKASLIQCAKILKKHDFAFIAPQSLDTKKYEEILQNENCKYSIKRFEDKDFKSLETYSNLLLEANFYKTFEDYEFIFLYQLDGWVFNDELDYWCNQEFDYIGAPWFEEYNKANEDSPLVSPSGNGGVSLRRTKSFINTLLNKDRIKNKHIKTFFEIIKERARENFIKGLNVFRAYNLYKNPKNIAGTHFKTRNEDYVIVTFFPQINPNFKIAPNTVNFKFSFEVNPRKLFKMNNNNLPFACHAFEKYDFEFWAQYITIE